MTIETIDTINNIILHEGTLLKNEELLLNVAKDLTIEAILSFFVGEPYCIHEVGLEVIKHLFCLSSNDS